MHAIFPEELEHVGRELCTMADLAAAELRGASVALLEADTARAHEVIRGTEAMRRLQADLEKRTIGVCTRQRPVAASDLRPLFAALRISADLERMSSLTAEIAQLAQRRHPARVIPEALVPLIARMAETGAELADGASHLINGHDFEDTRSLEADDEAVDVLYCRLLAVLFAPNADYETQTALDVTLIGRYYERFADHAVSIARRVESVVSSIAA